MHDFETTESFANKLDEQDSLRNYREKFFIPKQSNGEDVLYFTGNSLGLQPKTTRKFIEQELKDWETFGVEGHFHAKNPWMPYHEFLTAQMAEVVGAQPIEVVVMNSLTVNLHLLMVSFYRPTEKRYKIVIEKNAFPSDQYAVQSQILFHQIQNSKFKIQNSEDWLIELTPREGETTLQTEDILQTIRANGAEIALILLGGVNYYTGQAFDFEAITKVGHEVGAIVGFDLAHAAGNLELKLHDWNVDFAAWCSYKYLNSGPFEQRMLRSAAALQAQGVGDGDVVALLMRNSPEAIELMLATRHLGAQCWQLSNPPIFQMASLRASLEIFHEARMKNLREKSVKLTNYLEFLLGKIETERIEIITPNDEHERGCQLSIRVRNADKSLFKAISERGVVADWREPDVIRVAPVPLYNSFMDVWKFVEILKDCLK